MQEYKHEFISPNEMMEVYLDFRIDTGSVVNKHFHDWIEIVYLIHSFSHKVDQKVMDRNQKNMKRIQFIMDYVEKHYTEAISIPEIAGEVGLNEIYFSRFFKKNMGITFLDYLYRVRLEKIYMDLLNTDWSIQEIRERHGFYNEKVFRRMFRDMYGCSPKEVRKKM